MPLLIHRRVIENKIVDIEKAKAHLKTKLRFLKGIEGIGISSDKDGKQCILVHVNAKVFPRVIRRIPASIDGYIVLKNSVPKTYFQTRNR